MNLLLLDWYGWALLVLGITSLIHDVVDSFKNDERPSYFFSVAALTMCLYLALEVK